MADDATSYPTSVDTFVTVGTNTARAAAPTESQRFNKLQTAVVAIQNKLNASRLVGGSGPQILTGSATPEAAVTAVVGSIYLRSGGGAGTSFYVKETGTGNTGWVAK